MRNQYKRIDKCIVYIVGLLYCILMSHMTNAHDVVRTTHKLSKSKNALFCVIVSDYIQKKSISFPKG